MKKVIISFALVFLAIILSGVIQIAAMGYRNYLILNQEYTVSYEMAVKANEIWNNYWLVIYFSFIPAILAVLNLGYRIYLVVK